MKTKSETTDQDHRCQNEACRKLLKGRNRNTKFCSPKCRYQAKQAAKPDSTEDDRWICQGCRYPKQPQAEIVKGDLHTRHPYSGKRPEFSGYCVLARREPMGCECPVCNPVEVEAAA